MISPSTPPNEEERLSALRALEILDAPPEERFDRITRIAQRVFGVPIALVSLVDKDRQWFLSRVGIEAAETPREVSFCGHAIMGDDVLCVTDAATDERFKNNPLVTADPGIRFYAGCPIEAPAGHKIGTLCVIDRQARELGEADLQTLRDLAKMVERELAVMQLATIDTLTHLHNRRGFLLGARKLLHFAKRMREPACLVFIDLDGLKNINDELGHDAGDQALLHTASLLSENLRESDILARLGGDEFCVLFSGTSALGASTAIERLQEAVDQYNGDAREGPRLSLSVGVADWYPTSGETLEDLMKRADAKMYTHKRSKRE